MYNTMHHKTSLSTFFAQPMMKAKVGMKVVQLIHLEGITLAHESIGGLCHDELVDMDGVHSWGS